jgi:hypothetical protein
MELMPHQKKDGYMNELTKDEFLEKLNATDARVDIQLMTGMRLIMTIDGDASYLGPDPATMPSNDYRAFLRELLIII